MLCDLLEMQFFFRSSVVIMFVVNCFQKEEQQPVSHSNAHHCRCCWIVNAVAAAAAVSAIK